MYDHGGMNRFYRLVWSDAKQAYVPIPEVSNKRGKRKGGVFATLAAAAIALLSAATGALADPGPRVITPVMHASAPAVAANTLPTGGQVVGGTGTMATSGTTQTITQTSQNLAIDWNSFSIGTDGKVIFNQPNSSAIALNRVLGGDASNIYGQLQANGQVFLINPNGILFAKGSQISVAGILASTRDMSVADFMAGNYHLSGSGSGTVVNDGAITAATGGYIALVGAQVVNDGTLIAQQGDIRLAAANDVTVQLDGGGLQLTIGQGAYDALVQNGGVIKADGGRIYLTADALDALSKASVNNTGLIEAETVDNVNGQIVLKGDMTSGTVNVAGTLDASAPNGGNGGAIETSAAQVSVANDATITTKAATGAAGNWLIDPVDFTIAATGGNMTGTALTTALGNSNVQIESSSGASGTSGSINVDDAVSWSAHSLTLTAADNVNINTVMTMTGTASVDFEPATANGGQSAVSGGTVNVGMGASGNFLGQIDISSTGTVTIGGQLYTVINSLGSSATDTTAGTLQGMQANLTGHYVLGSDIDASATSTWNSGAGFTSIGNHSNRFSGVFDGLGHTITGLTISNQFGYNGLFGNVNNGTLRNVGLANVSLNCNYLCGALAGDITGTVSNVSVAGTLTLTSNGEYGGLLIGGLDGGTVTNVYGSGTVNIANGADYSGGLMGYNVGAVAAAHIDATITAGNNLDVVGPLVGWNSGALSDSSASGSFQFGNDGQYIGGLVGQATSSGPVTNSSSSVALSGGNYGEYIGGLVGGTNGTTIASDSFTGTYAMGEEPEYSGGLVGDAEGATAITNSQVTTNITTGEEPEEFGGLVGYLDGGSISGSSYSGNISTGEEGRYLGGLVGEAYNGTISGSSASGSILVSGEDAVAIGGLVGYIENGSVTTSSAAVNISITDEDAEYVGGLIGETYDTTVDTVSATGTINITGEDADYIGGLIGEFSGGSLNKAYATGSITLPDEEADSVGGLIGEQNDGTVTNVYATGSSTATGDYAQGIGGLIGETNGSPSVSEAYTTGNVTVGQGAQQVGGFIGLAQGTTATDVYSTGTVTAGANGLNIAAFVGTDNYGNTFTHSFWDSSTAGQSTGSHVTEVFNYSTYTNSNGAPSNLGSGMTTAQMMLGANFTSATTANGNVNPAWDVTNDWIVYDGESMPLLRAFMTPLTISVSPTKTYDGTLAGNVVSYSTTPDSSLLFGTLSVSGVTSKNVGTYSVTVSGDYSDQQGYAITYQNGSITVNAAPLTVTATGGTQVYNGTLNANVTLGSNAASGDQITLSDTSATFATKDAGTGKTVSVSGISLSGTDADDYSLQNTTAATTTNVTAAPLTVTATGGTQVYNGTLTANITLASNAVSGDQVTLSDTSANLATKNVGNGKLVAVSGISLSGTDAVDYSLQDGSTTTTTNVTAAPLTVTATGGSQVYNGTLNANVTLTSNVISGDQVTLSDASASLATKDVGTGKTVTVAGISLSGTDAVDYSLQDASTTTTTNVTAAPLTVTAIGGSEAYNGTRNANVTLISNAVSGDQVTLSDTSATLATKDVGTGKTVTVAGISLSGTDADDYSLQNTAASTTTNVSTALLTVTAIGGSQVYNGTRNANVTLTSNAFSGDQVTLSDTSASLATKDVGTGKTVTVAGISLSGTDAMDYSLRDASTTTTTNVTAAPLTVTATGGSQVYSGTTNANVTLTSNAVSGDQVTLSDTSASLATKDVGTGKTVTVAGISLSGTDALDYSLQDASTTTTTNVTAAPLTVTATGGTQVYNGTTNANVTLTSNAVSGDQVTLSDTSASLATKDVGTGKAVSVSGIGLSGADAMDYSLQNTSANTTTNVTAALLTVTGNGVNRTYDGTTSVGVNLSSSGVIEGDTVDFSGTGTLGNKNAGTGKSVAISNITDSGADAGNYILATTTASGTVDIAQKAITVTGSGVDRTYNGTTSVGVDLASSGVISGDTVTFSGTGTLADKNAGTGKSVAISGITDSGTDAGNYTLANTTASGTVDIAQKAITVTGNGVDRAYDGTTDVGVDLASNGVVSGDSVSFSGTGTLADKNAGQGKTVSVAISATGADAGDYSYNTTGSTTVTIDPKAIQVALIGPISKTGDGTTGVVLVPANYVVSGLVSGDSLSVTQTSGQFADASAGTDKTVTAALSGSSYTTGSGTTLGNYALYVGTVSANVGEIDNPVTAPYQAALTSIPTTSASSSLTTTVFSTIIGASGPATSTGDSDDTIATDDKSGSVDGSIASMQTRDTLIFHRTFSIADGGIKLPSGVDDTDTSSNNGGTSGNGGQ